MTAGWSALRTGFASPHTRVWKRLVAGEPPATLGDFTTSPRVILISILAIGLGLVAPLVAWTLLHLINLFTNLFYFGRLGLDTSQITDSNLGLAIVVVPIAGGLIVGLMARYGSERIRGHGIPEAIEAILINGSRVQARVAILKPLSSAISIGSGGPFGAEGPIILTGGAIGSIFGQFLHISNIERRTLLVAGAAGGMSATFDAPLAAVLLAVELLLFEWKPRSFIPVALASVTAASARGYLLDPGPLFPVVSHISAVAPAGFLACIFVGVSAGLVSIVLTAGVYASEDAFHRLPIHWMWWPAIGGLVIGLGGLAFPEALGVGYPVIGELLNGTASLRVIIGVLIVKSVIWAVSLGSGTSGGVLAPLLMIGCSVGALEAHFLPAAGVGLWALVSMGALIGGTMRSPLTGIVFVLELTHDVDALLPVTISVVVAHGVTVLLLRRSILTEKVSRRGLHLGREYAPDPSEGVLVRDIFKRDVISLPAELSAAQLAKQQPAGLAIRRQTLYPVVDASGRLTGVITSRHLSALLDAATEGVPGCQLADLGGEPPVVASPDESLRMVADRMAQTARTVLPVVDPATQKLLGLVSVNDVLRVRLNHLENDQRRERHITIKVRPRAAEPPLVN